VSSTLKFDSPQLNVHINRAKAADLGISMSDIAGALNTMTGDNLVNYFSKLGYSYEVIPQMSDQSRRMAKQLDSIYVSTTSGKLVPLSTVVDYSYSVTPASLYQFQQLNAATLNAVMMPGISEGQALAFLQKTADHLLPTGMSYNYSGSLRQFVEEGDAMVYAFIFAILVIFLLLSMQFESFRDPIIILVSVPMSICGALIPLYLGAATINIYTQIGLITLVGLISKHGILMVEFANKLQETEGLSVRKAIEKASAIRLRPILMTTFAMVFGVFPLIFSHGAGSVSRHNVGLVIAFGMAIGTCFTLFVVPTMYTYLAKDRKKETNR
jgi:multidrug efflux pump